MTKQLLIACLDEKSFGYAVEIAHELRGRQLSVELYPTVAKLQKQLSYANDLGFEYVGLIGETERLSGEISLKNMKTGEQKAATVQDIVQIIAS